MIEEIRKMLCNDAEDAARYALNYFGCPTFIDRTNDIKSHKVMKVLSIKKVIFNEPATIIIWENGDKTIVKCQDGDTYDKEKGFALAVMKYAFGNKSKYNDVIKKFIKE